jgi:hypothetical protein
MVQYHSAQLLGHSQRQINITKLTVVFPPPKHTQHGLHLRGTDFSDHLHASADLTLEGKAPMSQGHQTLLLALTVTVHDSMYKILPKL